MRVKNVLIGEIQPAFCLDVMLALGTLKLRELRERRTLTESAPSFLLLASMMLTGTTTTTIRSYSIFLEHVLGFENIQGCI